MKKIPVHYREAIHNSVDQLADFPKCKKLDISELKDHRYDYRLRVGRCSSALQLCQRRQNYRNTRG
jgi:hypothetical protein